MATRLPYPATNYSEGVEIISDQSSVEAKPQVIIDVGNATRVLTYTRPSGTVSTLDLTIWDFINGEWYKKNSCEDELTGDGNEVRQWEVYPDTTIGFTVSAISGGGTVSVRIRGFR